MGLIPKPELKDTPLSMVITQSMDKKLRAFAKKNSVNRSEAARYIIENYFGEVSENSEVMTPKNETDYGKIGVAS